jgi:hypothetical protein
MGICETSHIQLNPWPNPIDPVKTNFKDKTFGSARWQWMFRVLRRRETPPLNQNHFKIEVKNGVREAIEALNACVSKSRHPIRRKSVRSPGSNDYLRIVPGDKD